MVSLTSAIVAFGNLTVVRKTRVFEAFEVLLNRLRPALSEISTLRFGTEVESDDILAVELALEVDDAKTFPDRFFLKTENQPSAFCDLPSKLKRWGFILTIAMR